jgi:hypothetical protein
MIRCEESPHAGRCGRSACNRGVEGRQKTVIARHLGNSLHNWAKPFRVKHQELTPTPACVLEFFDLARVDVRRPVPRLTLPHHVVGSWLFAAALAQAQQRNG